MSEELLPCWSCGSTDLHVYKGHRGKAVKCFGCGIQGVLVSQWQARSLPAAIDTVVEAVENDYGRFFEAIQSVERTEEGGVSLPIADNRELVQILRALRTEAEKEG